MIINSITRFDLVTDSDSLKHHTESRNHYLKKKQIASEYLENGYVVGVEEQVYGYVVDVIAVNDTEVIVIEVGSCKNDKINDLKSKKEITEVKNPDYNRKKATASVSLPTYLLADLDEKVDNGKYDNRSAAIQEAIKIMLNKTSKEQK